MPLQLEPGAMDRTRGSLPLYAQLANHIRQAITSSDLHPKEALPSAAQLSAMADVSDMVVRQALDRLADEGLIVRRSGTATRVAEPPTVRRIDAGRYAEDIRRLVAGQEPETPFVTDNGATWADYSVTDVEYSVEPASERDMQLLDLKPGDRVMRRRMVKRLWGRPYQLHRSAVPLRIAEGTVLADPSRQPMPGGTLAELFEVGLIPTSVVEEVEPSRHPDNTERRLLDLSGGGHVWKIERVFYAAPGWPVEASRAIEPAARSVLRFQTALTLD